VLKLAQREIMPPILQLIVVKFWTSNHIIVDVLERADYICLEKASDQITYIAIVMLSQFHLGWIKNSAKP
jgi:hypothetical protein